MNYMQKKLKKINLKIDKNKKVGGKIMQKYVKNKLIVKKINI